MLVRHTTPIGGAGRCYGRTDLLVDAADVMATTTLLVERLSTLGGGGAEGAPVARVVTSPLLRARVLAEAVAAALGLELVVDARLAEMDFGAWEGMFWDEVPRDELDAWAADLLGYRGHGGESVADLAVRVADGLADCGGDELVVCHLGVIRAALADRGADDPWTVSVSFGELVVLPDEVRPDR